MPRGDGTGPAGAGPMTGRGAGFCAGSEMPGFARRWGAGPGFNGVRGRGGRTFQGAGRPGFSYWCRTYDTAADDADEKALLKRRAGILEEQLEQVNRRLSLLERDA